MKKYHNYRNNKGQFVESPSRRNQRALDELYRAFDFFNERFADGKLPKVIITIQEAGRRNAVGWFGNSFWKDEVCDQGVCEINLSAEWLGSSDSTLCTLLHEMAHLWNAKIAKERDCTSGQYHNKHFKRAAEMFGLKVHRIKGRGYAGTTLGEEASQSIDDLNPDEQVISSLKRKRVKKIYVKRYMSLIVGSEFEDVVTAGMRKHAMTQKQFVEHAISLAVGDLEYTIDEQLATK